jgi:hypothetical protein
MNYGNVYGMLGPGETVIRNPSETKLVNATKISGRTKKKLGIGFFNAITKAQYATVENASKEQYQVQTNPLTNYNVLVLDQAMKNNSTVALVNTNVWRSGSDYDANVTALLWDLYDRKIDWNVWGQISHSRLSGYEAPGKTTPGYHYNAFLGKFKGRFNFDVHRFYADKNYNQRDLGFFNNNNYVDHGFYAGYKWIKPKRFYNNIYLNINGTFSQQHQPRLYQHFRINGNINSQLKNLWQVGIAFDWRAEAHDFYEPRIVGRMIKLPASGMIGFWVNTNSAKKYSANFEVYHRTARKYKSHMTEASAGSNYRFNDRLSIGISSYIEYFNKNLGFAMIPAGTDSVIIGLRNRRTADNVLSVKYNFNNKMGLNFRLRHYWSKVDYKRLFNLDEEGGLTEISGANGNPNNNVNFFNIDMNYTWQFAPGSFINVNWKSSSEIYNQLVADQYFRNLKHTLQEPQINNFSVKIIYFLDYLNIQGKKKQMKTG